MTRSTKPKISSLTNERVKSLIWYDPETGLGGRIGNPMPLAMKPTSAGYKQIMVDGTTYLWHRLSWFYMTGAWPKEDIDHINRDRLDNRWCNLREATRSQNLFNKSVKINKVGLRGVSYHKASKLYQARVCRNGKEAWRQFFDCPAAAHLSYLVMADKIFGEFSPDL